MCGEALGTLLAFAPATDCGSSLVRARVDYLAVQIVAEGTFQEVGPLFSEVK
jgi:hypothetical protein